MAFRRVIEGLKIKNRELLRQTVEAPPHELFYFTEFKNKFGARTLLTFNINCSVVVENDILGGC